MFVMMIKCYYGQDDVADLNELETRIVEHKSCLLFMRYLERLLVPSFLVDANVLLGCVKEDPSQYQAYQHILHDLTRVREHFFPYMKFTYVVLYKGEVVDLSFHSRCCSFVHKLCWIAGDAELVGTVPQLQIHFPAAQVTTTRMCSRKNLPCRR